MKLTERTKWFIYGLVTAFALTAAFHVSTALAASAEKQITVLIGGIRVFVDGVQVNATDNAGKPLEPIVYNGTTYLPVKAVADALNMPMKWDGKTSSVYLGKDDQGKTFLSDLSPYTTANLRGVIYNNDQQRYEGKGLDNYTMTSGEKQYAKGIGVLGWNFNNTMYLMYNMNGKYRTLRGKVAFQDQWEKEEATIKFNVDGTLRKQVVLRKGDLPKEYSVDLDNCLQLKIEIGSDHCDAAFNLIEPILE